MSYVSLGDIGALPAGLPPLPKDFKHGYVEQTFKTVSPAVKAQLLADGLKAIPKCWGVRSQNCANARFDAPLVWATDQCRALAYGYVGDWDRMDAAVEKVQDCDERAPLITGIMAGCAGLVVGLVIGKALRG